MWRELFRRIQGPSENFLYFYRKNIFGRLTTVGRQFTDTARIVKFSCERVSMGLTVRRKTAKNLAVRRKNERILAVSRKKN